MIDFAETLEDCRLFDPGFDGANFTWAKNSLFERLDRIFLNEAWASVFDSTRVTNLPRVASDHGPVLMRCLQAPTRHKARAFRFQNMWIRHPQFLDVIRDDWSQDTGAGGLLNLQMKLARLKKTLKTWNNEVFGNAHANLKAAEELIVEAQTNFEADPSPQNRAAINKHIATYILTLKMEEDFWRQKATLRWLSDGDRNTKFYQSWVKQKRVRLHIHKIHANGRDWEEEADIQNSAVAFFQDLLAPDPIQLSEPDLSLIQELPPSTDLEALITTPALEEIKRAAFDISGDSTPGPDGYTASFFQSCWTIVGHDVSAAVRQFFLGAYLPRSITATSIVLIPKKEAPVTWSDFRPISLCNVTNKIITKILTARITPLLPLVVSQNQSGFVKGRLLNDNVLLAQEMFHELPRCSPNPNVAIKIDMAKAYDRVQWPFLLKILRRMGFPELWISLIDRCIGWCWFSILVNGSPSGFFKATRGLRQGDPISPALFVIAADYLSRSLDKLILGNRNMTYKSTRRCMEISHLAYADDILIFAQAGVEPMSHLRSCLAEYEAVSGQLINATKSNFFIAEIHDDWASDIQRFGGYTKGSFPFLYLGVPIFRGPKRTDMFLFLRDKIARRINGWAHRHLSFGGRLTLIKSTLEAIPLHIFQAIEPTKGALKQLDQLLARFFWGSNNDRRTKTHWISWEQICRPTAEGGLGIRRFKEVLRAFNLKLWWRFREHNSLWAVHLQHKYCRTSSPFTQSVSSRCSPTWRRLARFWAQVQPHIRWVIGSGDIYFWDDIWLGNVPLRDVSLDDRGHPTARVSDYWDANGWCMPKLQLLHYQAGLPQHIVDEIVRTPILIGEQDIPRWNLSRTGNFTLASAWETIRTHRPLIPALDDLWKAGIPASIAIFVWRLLSNRVPVDTKLQWRHIELASKCHCCQVQPGIESLQHLFVQGAGASKIWEEFDVWFAGNRNPLHINDTIPDRLEAWSKRICQSAPSHLSRVTPCLILWFIWTARNKSRHDGIRFKPINVIWQVKLLIRNLMTGGKIGPKQWKGMSTTFDLPHREERRRPLPMVVPIKWNPPDPPWVKLNAKGNLRDATGIARGGGIIRDHRGALLKAFATPLRAGSVLEAELSAVLHGLLLAKEFGTAIWIESEAAQVISLINTRNSGPAQSRHLMAQITLIQRSCVLKATFVHREGNMVAESLVNMAPALSPMLIFDGLSAPRHLKAIVRMEQMGIPNIRVENEE